MTEAIKLVLTSGLHQRDQLRIIGALVELAAALDRHAGEVLVAAARMAVAPGAQ